MWLRLQVSYDLARIPAEQIRVARYKKTAA
jgi:plasmid maintenance system antidote protein VapI